MDITMKKLLLFANMLMLMSLALPAQESKKYNDAQNMPVVLQQEAYYPGGQAALLKYFRDNIRYPQEAIDNKISGEVMVSFEVMPDSSLQDITLISGVDYGVDEEVIRLFKDLKYAPSIQNGVKLKMNVMVTIPVRARSKTEQ